MVEEADELGGVGEVGGLVRAAGDVAEVGAREAVDGPSVAADGNGFGDDGGDLDEVLGEGDGAVFVDGAEGAAVPVVGDALVARGPGQGAVGCFGDGEEGFQGVFVEDAVGVFGGVVGH